ncbi:MAG: tetratricopeptide repeat protein [Thermodesulfobacteriota bacterium]|nr:tetratricopeptide repeat protein [Thermodesulfobacteriota bacterium]
MSAKNLILAGVLIVAVMAVYMPSLHCGFIWDDDYYVTENRVLKVPGGLKKIWTAPGATPQYYPMVFTTFWMEYKISGDDPFIYHLDNILLHAANAVLLWQLLMRLGVPWAWFAAAVFALHPVQVESVSWISERKNVLSLFFGLATLLVYCRFLVIKADGRGSAVRRWGLYGLALLVLTAALLSKSVTATIPVVILAVMWWKRGRLTWNDALLMVPFLAIGAAAGYHTAAMEIGFVGARGASWDLSLIERCLIAGRAVWFYIGKLAYPHPLIFIYPRWHIDAGAWWQYLYPFALIAVMAGLWYARRKTGRGVLTGGVCFIVLLSPALGFVNFFPMKYSFVADHFQYHATPAMIALFAAGAAWVFRRAGAAIGKAGVMVLAMILLAGLAARTWHEQDKYESPRALWLDTIVKNPACSMAHNNLGVLFGSTGKKDKDAYRQFKEAVKHAPCNYLAYHNMGMYLMGDAPEKAIPYFKKALECQPRSLRVLHQLGRAYLQTGEPKKAIPVLLKLTAGAQSSPKAHYLLGRAFYRNGEYKKAINAFSNVLTLAPDYPGAAAGLVAARKKIHRLFEAVE